MSKVFKAVVVGALIAVGIAFILPLVGLSSIATPFAGLFGIKSTLLAALIGGGITGGLSSLLAPSLDLTTAQNRVRVSVDPDASMKWVFGETALATDIVFTAQHGSDDQFYSYIIAGAGHEIDSFGDLFVNDELIAFSGDLATGDWSDTLARQTRLGTEVQTAFTNLDGADGFAPNLWPATADGLGMAHYRLRWTLGEDKISSGVPTRITQVVKGGPVYDPRLDSTRGGSGTHRADDQTTWQYNDGTDDIGANWALVVLRYLIGWKINGKLVIGVGIDPDDIDMDQAIAAANVCEVVIDGKPRYRVGGILPVTNDHPNIIRQLEGAINGKISIIGGKYYIWAPNDDLTPFSDIGESDLIRQVGVHFTPSGPMEKLYNTGRGSFISNSATDLFNLVPYPEVEEAAALAEDGVVRILNHDLALIQDVSIAERVVRGMVRRSRFGASWRFALGPKGLTFQPFTVTTLNIQETNNVNVTVRIIDMSYSISGAVILEVIEEDSSIYDTTAPLGTPVTQLDPGGFDPNTKIAVTGLTSLDITVRGDQGTASDALKVTWDDPGQWVRETQVQYKVASEADFQSVPAVRVDLQQAIILPVEQNTLYDIRARHITQFGVVGDYASIQDTTGDDFTGQPTTAGFTKNFEYDDLDTTTLAAGPSRYAMLSDSGVDTSGSQNDFHLTQAILINKIDLNGFTAAAYIANLQPDDRVVYFISTTRWFHFKITARPTIVGTGAATAYKFLVTLIEHVDGNPTANQPDTPGNTVEFQFFKPLDDSFNILLDPDFDLTTDIKGSGAGTDDGFWISTFNDLGSAGAFMTFRPGLGAGGSNALDMKRGDFGAQIGLQTLRKPRVSYGAFEFRIKYKTLTTGFDANWFSVFVAGFQNQEDTTSIGASGETVNLPLSLNVWTTARIIVDVSQIDDARFWQFGMNFNTTTESVEVRIDSIYVYGISGIFGTEELTDPVSGNTFKIEGAVPRSDTTADAGKVLQADSTWVTNASGASNFNDLNDVNLIGAVDNDLLFRSGGDWIDTAGLLTWDAAKLRIAGDLVLLAATPKLEIEQTGATAEEGNWRVFASADQLIFATVNDARTIAATWLAVDRTANSADTAAFQTAVTATSFGGILQGDLLSKIATEIITGVYTHTAQLVISSTVANRLNLTGLSVGSDVIALPAAAGLRNTTNQGGIGFYCDSSLLLHAGDNITAMLSDLGITATDTKENIYLTADSFIDVWSNRQSSFAASEHFQFRTDGGFQVFVPTGTAPLVVASTTKVANLNADLLDGQSGAFYENVVDSVFGRTDAVVAQESDYNAFYITDNATSTLTAQLTIGTLGSIKWNTAINAFWGNSQEASILFTGGNWIMSAPLSGEFQLNMGAEKFIQMFANSRVRIFFNNAIRLDTTVDGIDVEGGGISIAEFAAAPADRAGRGFYWARTDNAPMFTTEAGVDIVLSAGGDVSRTGTPLNDQVAIWTNATTIEGDPNLIFDTGGLTIFAPEIRVENAGPLFTMRDTDSPVDEKVYRFGIIAGIFTGNLVTDDELSSTQWLLVDRSGTSALEVGIRGGANFRVYGPNNIDYIEFDHDNTDLNTNFVGTVDWNIDAGLTGGVIFANLAHFHAGIHLNDSDQLQFGNLAGGDVRLQFAGTDFFFDMVNGVDFRLRGGSSGTDLMLVALDDNAIELYFNNVLEARTTNSNATDNISGMEVKDDSQTFRQVGFVDMEELGFAGNLVVIKDHWHKCLVQTGATTRTLTFNTASTVPNFVVMWVKAEGGNVTLVDGTMVLSLYDGSGAPATGNITITRGGWATIHKTGDSTADVTGVGLS